MINKILIFLVFCCLILCSCSEQKKIVILTEWDDLENPAKYDLIISIISYRIIFDDMENIPYSHRMIIKYMDDSLLINNIKVKINSVEQEINDSIVEMPFVEFNFTSGIFYELEVTADNYYAKVRLKIPFEPVVSDFPSVFDPEIDTTLNWVLEQNSQAQFANLYSSGNENNEFVNYEFTSIHPKKRQYIFKARTAPLNRHNYSLYILNVNFIPYEKVIFLALDGNQRHYNTIDSNQLNYELINNEIIENILKELKQ